MKKLITSYFAIAFIVLLSMSLLLIGQTDLGSTTYKGTHAWKTQTRTIVLLAPVTGDSGLAQFQLPQAATITRVSSYTIGAATDATINLNKRAEATPATSGTNVLSAGLVADTDSQTSCASGCTVNTITSGATTARELVALTISSVTGTPTSLVVHIEFVYD